MSSYIPTHIYIYAHIAQLFNFLSASTFLLAMIFFFVNSAFYAASVTFFSIHLMHFLLKCYEMLFCMFDFRDTFRKIDEKNLRERVIDRESE